MSSNTTHLSFFDIADSTVESIGKLDRECLLSAVVKHTPECVKLITADGTLLDMNPAGLALIEADNWQQVDGANVYDLMAPEHLEAYRKFNERVCSGNKESFEFEIIALRGTRRWMQTTAVPMRLPSGESVQLAITRDISADKSRQIEVNLAKEKAEAASSAKSEFLANMSHEIRTPMTAILGYADLLEVDGQLTSDRAHALDAIRTIKANSNHLLRIINDILDMSKIDSGKMSVESIKTSPALIIDEVTNLVRCQCDGKRLELHVIYESAIPKSIESDPTRLRQILLNLVGNAIKFTQLGSVTLSVSFCLKTNFLYFDVIDTGIGMSPEQRDRIARFDAFSQADSSTTRKFGGSGLGLRICNSLAIMLGGGITVESEVGAGSRFTLAIDVGNPKPLELLTKMELKAIKEKSPPQQPPIQFVYGAPLEGTRVLFAEDGPDNQRLISFHLRKAGAEVCLAENGLVAVQYMEEAIAKATALPDIILMDMQMPEMDGYTATARLRALGYTLPIVALTAHAMDSDRQKCLDAGCNNYLTKPIDKDMLIGLCHSFTKNRLGSPVAHPRVLPELGNFPPNRGVESMTAVSE